jgi:hypothetical protein
VTEKPVIVVDLDAAPEVQIRHHNFLPCYALECFGGLPQMTRDRPEEKPVLCGAAWQLQLLEQDEPAMLKDLLKAQSILSVQTNADIVKLVNRLWQEFRLCVQSC